MNRRNLLKSAAAALAATSLTPFGGFAVGGTFTAEELQNAGVTDPKAVGLRQVRPFLYIGDGGSPEQFRSICEIKTLRIIA